MQNKTFQTQAVHGGEKPDSMTGASVPNIVMSSTYVVDEPVSFSVTNLSDEAPFVYTRWANPTIQQLEQKLCLLENAECCIAQASGMAASTGVLYALLNAGDHLIISNVNYPGTAELARNGLVRKGVEVTPIDTSDADAVRAAVRDNTRLIWIETPANPLLRLTDIAQVAAIAHEAGAWLAVDSTFATPVATRPLDLGADIVVHSLTKYIGGHGDALGGAILGSHEIMTCLRAGGVMHFGSTMSPFNAWLIMRGAATLPLRMAAHASNARAVAQFLAAHAAVEVVRYPGLESHPQHALAAQQMHNYSGMVAFRVKQPQPTARRMMQELEVIHYAVSLGHHRSLIYLMDTQDLVESSYRLEGDELEKYRAIAGDGIFRLSVGLEGADDLIADLERVL